MAHMIEAAKSGRASCRTCKQPIAKGELRVGEEVPNQFSEGEMTYQWHHLPCAAQKKPAVLKQALETTTVDVPDKDQLLQSAQASGKNEKPSTFPYAEHAPTSRASCLSCQERIEKGDLRVAVENEVNGFMRPGYLHPACAPDHTEQTAGKLFAQVKANSLNLDDKELERLQAEMGVAGDDDDEDFDEDGE